MKLHSFLDSRPVVDKSQRYKMYKDGKNWVYAGLTALALGAGLAAPAAADLVSGTDTFASAATVAGQNAVASTLAASTMATSYTSSDYISLSSSLSTSVSLVESSGGSQSASNFASGSLLADSMSSSVSSSISSTIAAASSARDSMTVDLSSYSSSLAVSMSNLLSSQSDWVGYLSYLYATATSQGWASSFVFQTVPSIASILGLADNKSANTSQAFAYYSVVMSQYISSAVKSTVNDSLNFWGSIFGINLTSAQLSNSVSYMNSVLGYEPGMGNGWTPDSSWLTGKLPPLMASAIDSWVYSSTASQYGSGVYLEEVVAASMVINGHNVNGSMIWSLASDWAGATGGSLWQSLYTDSLVSFSNSMIARNSSYLSSVSVSLSIYSSSVRSSMSYYSSSLSSSLSSIIVSSLSSFDSKRSSVSASLLASSSSLSSFLASSSNSASSYFASSLDGIVLSAIKDSLSVNVVASSSFSNLQSLYTSSFTPACSSYISSASSYLNAYNTSLLAPLSSLVNYYATNPYASGDATKGSLQGPKPSSLKAEIAKASAMITSFTAMLAAGGWSNAATTTSFYSALNNEMSAVNSADWSLIIFTVYRGDFTTKWDGGLSGSISAMTSAGASTNSSVAAVLNSMVSASLSYSAQIVVDSNAFGSVHLSSLNSIQSSLASLTSSLSSSISAFISGRWSEFSSTSSNLSLSLSSEYFSLFVKSSFVSTGNIFAPSGSNMSYNLASYNSSAMIIGGSVGASAWNVVQSASRSISIVTSSMMSYLSSELSSTNTIYSIGSNANSMAYSLVNRVSSTASTSVSYSAGILGIQTPDDQLNNGAYFFSMFASAFGKSIANTAGLSYITTQISSIVSSRVSSMVQSSQDAIDSVVVSEYFSSEVSSIASVTSDSTVPSNSTWVSNFSSAASIYASQS